MKVSVVVLNVSGTVTVTSMHFRAQCTFSDCVLFCCVRALMLRFRCVRGSRMTTLGSSEQQAALASLVAEMDAALTHWPPEAAVANARHGASCTAGNRLLSAAGVACNAEQ